MARARLPNSPLQEASCEVRFNGSLSLLSSWGPFQNRIRKDFPSLLVPFTQLGTAPLLQHLRLASASDGSMVFLAINSFAFSTRNYSMYSDFRARFENLWTIFLSECEPGELTRVGIRFINALPSVFENHSTNQAIHPCLRLSLGGAPVNASEVEQGQFVFDQQSGRARLRVALTVPQAQAPVNYAVPSQPQPGVAMPSTNLDLDVGITQELATDKVLAALDEAHTLADNAFFAMVTPEYLAYLKGT